MKPLSIRGRVIIVMLIALLMMILCDKLEAQNSHILTKQSLSITYQPHNNGIGLLYRNNHFITSTNHGKVIYSTESINQTKFGIGTSFIFPTYLGGDNSASIDIVLNYNIYSNKNTQFLIDENLLKPLTLELGLHKQLSNKIIVTFHYDIVNREGKIGFGIKLKNHD